MGLNLNLVQMATELIFAEITWPDSLSKEEAVRRTINLVPEAVSWEEIQADVYPCNWAVGNLECEEGTYNGKEMSFGPDEAGVKVNWSVP